MFLSDASKLPYAPVLAYHVCNSKSGATYISKSWFLNHFLAAHAFTDDVNQLMFPHWGGLLYLAWERRGKG